MAESTVLAKARKARFDDLPNFSGRPSEDLERFLDSIKNITDTKTTANQQEVLEIVRGKLTKAAGLWFDKNQSTFKTWIAFETAIRNRYLSTTASAEKFKKLTRRVQQPDESVTDYFDEIVELCREIEPEMSDSIIIRHLMNGINPHLQKELSRRQPTTLTLPNFLEYAKIEQDLYNTYDKFRKLSLESQPCSIDATPSMDPPVTTTVEPKQQRPRYNHTTFKRNSFNPRNSNQHIQRNSTNPPRRQTQQPRTPPKNTTPSSTTTPTSNQTSSCKVCGRTNHRTIDCFYKRNKGCFNCGRNHAVRDCILPPNFQ